MKKENILYLEKMGCDFYLGDEINNISDMINHRYYAKNIITKDNINIDTLEIMNGARYDSNLKLKDYFKLYITTYCYAKNDNCYGIYKLDAKISNQDLLYTQSNVLKIVNEISKIHYDKIKFVEKY